MWQPAGLKDPFQGLFLVQLRKSARPSRRPAWIRWNCFALTGMRLEVAVSPRVLSERLERNV
jgi:hypothetical protein